MRTDRATRRFKDLCYPSKPSWSRSRLVVAKAEQLVGRANPHFGVTSLGAKAWPVRAHILLVDGSCGDERAAPYRACGNGARARSVQDELNAAAQDRRAGASGLATDLGGDERGLPAAGPLRGDLVATQTDLIRRGEGIDVVAAGSKGEPMAALGAALRIEAKGGSLGSSELGLRAWAARQCCDSRSSPRSIRDPCPGRRLVGMRCRDYLLAPHCFVRRLPLTSAIAPPP